MTFNFDESTESLDAKSGFSRASLRGFMVVVIIAILLGFFVGRCTAPHGTSKPAAKVTSTMSGKTDTSKPRKSVLSANSQTVPANVLATLKKIDAGMWPPANDPGTHGGTIWGNREHQLPSKDAHNHVIIYREWDVNRKIPYHERDGQRIITGSDGSAYYTLDHYRTLIRIR